MRTFVDSVSLEQWLESLPAEERATVAERMRARIASRQGLGILENYQRDGVIFWRATWEKAYANVCSWLTYFMAGAEERRQVDALYSRWCVVKDEERKAHEYGHRRDAMSHAQAAQELWNQRNEWIADIYARPLPDAWDARYPQYLVLLESEHARGRKADEERAAEAKRREAILTAGKARRNHKPKARQ